MRNVLSSIFHSSRMIDGCVTSVNITVSVTLCAGYWSVVVFMEIVHTSSPRYEEEPKNIRLLFHTWISSYAPMVMPFGNSSPIGSPQINPPV